MTTTQPRQPAGTPIGGEFATKQMMEPAPDGLSAPPAKVSVKHQDIADLRVGQTMWVHGNPRKVTAIEDIGAVRTVTFEDGLVLHTASAASSVRPLYATTDDQIASFDSAVAHPAPVEWAHVLRRQGIPVQQMVWSRNDQGLVQIMAEMPAPRVDQLMPSFFGYSVLDAAEKHKQAGVWVEKAQMVVTAEAAQRYGTAAVFRRGQGESTLWFAAVSKEAHPDQDPPMLIVEATSLMREATDVYLEEQTTRRVSDRWMNSAVETFGNPFEEKQ